MRYTDRKLHKKVIRQTRMIILRHDRSLLKVVAWNEHFSTNQIIRVGFLVQFLIVGLIVCQFNAR